MVNRAAVLKQDYELAGHIQKKMDFELQVCAECLKMLRGRKLEVKLDLCIGGTCSKFHQRKHKTHASLLRAS